VGVIDPIDGQQVEMDIGCETDSGMPAFLEFVHFADRDAEFFLRIGDLLARGHQGVPWKRILMNNLGCQMRIYLLDE
jgi:hypothetical protein